MRERLVTGMLMMTVLFIMNAISLVRFLPERFLLVAAALTLIFPLGLLLERRFANKFTSVIYRIGVAWFESMWILLSLVIVAFGLDVLGVTIPLLDQIVLFSWILFTILGVLYSQTWKITEVVVHSSKIKKKLTLVHLTDIHAFGAYAKEWVHEAINQAKKLHPDVIVLTGDIIDQPSVPEDVLDIRSKTPLLYTLGNHEFYLGEGVAKERASRGDLQLLSYASKDIGGVHFIGIDDGAATDHVKKHISPLVHKEKYNVLLYHRPRGMEDAANAGVDLMLSGHTHGGVNFPMHIFVSMVYGKYYRGLHKIKDLILYTSNGAGTRNWPLRLFNPQEIVKFTLLPEE
jgi:predicted MPP superfamily phosphohydrolase